MTTILTIYVNILQKLLDAGSVVEMHTIIEQETPAENEVETKSTMIDLEDTSLRIQSKIEVDEEQKVFANGQGIDDIDDILFELSLRQPGTDLALFCQYVTELADAGHIVQVKIDEQEVRVLEVELANNEKLRVLYISIEDAEQPLAVERNLDTDVADQFYHMSEELDYSTHFYVLYNKVEADFRLYPPDFDQEAEDAVELYERIFLPRMQASRDYDEVPGLIYH
ncbi:hypothetical protein KDA_73160 [Dictyobacter alpinus]|uniref:Uncharacterized protein n=1 Tax=Dictyobacter alpinus TaxID=2014873 RepID=A0A402BKH2_9CHLR|nr:hypothetical protein [Dictyobacter alpinus]GCE31832.1 hypothetical protein KDA_73160 [Dictyobacter alpinus]